MRRAHYSNDELEACKLADEIADGVPVDMAEVRRLLGTLACDLELTRYQRDTALTAAELPTAKRRARVSILKAEILAA